MGLKQRYLLIGGVVGAFFCGGALYASPYLTLYQMYQAVEHHDTQGISNHVNFPALRESVKANLQSVVEQETQKQDNPLMGILGKILGSGVLNPVMDTAIGTIVTPEGVAALLEGQRLQLGGGQEQAQFSEKAASVDVNPHYESFNQFVVSVKPKGEDTEPVELILSREFLDWKVSGVRLPRDSARLTNSFFNR
jgi:Protein of unknown function (DUF2939)